MTAQVADRLIYNRDTLRLFSNPLEAYWSKVGGWRPRFVALTTSNWRGYVATWEIRSGTLILIDIAGTALMDSLGQMRTSNRHFMDESLGIP